jgi:hypothetical protein
MKDKNRDNDPIKGYIEWSEHRYDPGYYLGGNLPPHLRKGSLGPSARRMAGLFIGVIAVFSLLSGIASVGLDRDAGPWTRLIWIFFVVLTSSAAVTMYRSGRSKSSSPRRRRRAS